MKKYFKHEAESDVGVGMAYMEITDGWPTRQVEVYDDIWRWADEANKKWLADQPLDVLGLSEQHEISSQEFERIWQEAKKNANNVY